MIRSSRALVGTAAIALLATAGNAHAFTAPSFKGTNTSIPSPGYPDFWALNYSASLTKDSAGTVYTLSIVGSNSDYSSYGIFNFPNGAYAVGNEKIKVTVNFDSTGHLISTPANTYEIDGSLPAWGSPTFGTKPAGFSWAAQPIEKLFSANLTDVTVDSTHEALGFKSSGFGGWANQNQFTSGSTAESLWLYTIVSDSGSSSGSSWSTYSSTTYAAWNAFLAEVKNHTKLQTGTFYGIASIATVPLPAGVLLFGSGLAGLGTMLRRRKLDTAASAAA